jgi:hypothetical protein
MSTLFTTQASRHGPRESTVYPSISERPEKSACTSRGSGVSLSIACVSVVPSADAGSAASRALTVAFGRSAIERA